MLAAYPANRSQCHPFRFNPANFEPWLRETGLEPDEADRFRRLTYTQEDVVCFSDGNILQASLSPEKFRQLVRALQSEPTFLMSLQVDEGMDIEPLISYWGRGREAQRMRPLLESLTQIPGGGSVNVSYLLPPFARLRLYTYDNSPDSCSRRYNCSWTALNFFNETPDERFADFDRAMEYLGRRYQAVTSPPQFGDVMVVEESSGRPLHFCVFLADGVVFTKNGFDYLEPWVLMKVPEMLAYFHGTKGTKTVVYRPAKG